MNEESNSLLVETSVKESSLNIRASKNWVLRYLPKTINASYGRKRMTAIVLHGTLAIALALTLLLVINGLLVNKIQVARIIIGIFIFGYLVTAEVLVNYKKYLASAWMLIILYGSIASVVLLNWSLNTPLGILTIGFTVLLAGILLGTKHIFKVTCGVIVILCIVQYTHSTGIIMPDLSPLARESHFMDVLAYSTIIGIFALISWLSGKQTEHSIERALQAEEKIKAEKINLVHKLEEQSVALRQTQLQEMASLYKFAAIGQSTTATLHELSNQLSVLTLDIDDLHLRHRQSEAIQNAKEGIDNINLLVRQTRKQLQDNQEFVRFNALPIIDRTIKELQPKFNAKNVLLHKSIAVRASFQLLGDPSNLSHTLTILLKNAFDACVSQDNAKIQVNVRQKEKELEISVTDNGPGLAIDSRHLFLPHKSSKPNGLGIGLYVTKQIIESQFKGKIHAKKLDNGTEFTILLPRHKKE